MNEEKKLTAEEIVKALDFCYSSPCCGSGCPYFNKHGRNFCVEDKALYKDMKRIVQENAEQKTEIERLTEELKNCGQELIESNREQEELQDRNAELQKQVDELKERAKIDLENEKNWGKIQTKQAVKDTAKEILQMLYDDRNGYWDSCDCGKDETYWRDNSIQGTLNEIKERYGVEVEE